MPETALGTKNRQLHGRVFFVVKGRKEQRVLPNPGPPSTATTLNGTIASSNLSPTRVIDRAAPLNSARPGVAIVRLSMRTLSTDMKNLFFPISTIPRLYVGITNG